MSGCGWATHAPHTTTTSLFGVEKEWNVVERTAYDDDDDDVESRAARCRR